MTKGNNPGAITTRAQRPWRSCASSLLIAIAAIVTGSGCTNNLLRSAPLLAKNSVDSANPFSGSAPLGSSSSPVTLSRVVKNVLSPSDTFDLHGDSTGAIGQYCTSSSSGGQSQGTTTCNCSYTYTKADGSIESFETPTIYRESNMIRCRYIGVPTSIPFVKVKIHLTNADMFSNEVTFKFTGTGLSLDLADPASYALVQRYQCRDIVTVPNVFGGIYDPIQSEDPSISYPLNFYTTNTGGTFALYATKDAGFNCPSLPNDTAAGLDLTLYSVGPDSAGSKRIFPPAGSAFDRSTFLLARRPSGIFNIPVHARAAPSINTQNLDENGNPQPNSLPPLGFAAMPIPGGAGQETCPDSIVTIPQGYHFVKVWLFRASFRARVFFSSPMLQRLGVINCNPGDWDANNPIFADCGLSTSHGGSSLIAGNGGAIGDRIFEGTAACFKMHPRTVGAFGVGATTKDSGEMYNANGVNFTAFPPGADVYFARHQDPAYGCGGTNTLENANICAEGAAYDPAPIKVEISSDSADSRSDFLFVVSPPSVMVNEMRESSTQTVFRYTPYRFMSPGDCKSVDPDVPSSAGDCPSRRKISYGIKLHDVGSPGDPGGDDPDRAGVFPVCALQPD